MDEEHELKQNRDELEKVVKTLRQHEESYKQILDDMMEGFQIIGKDWRYIYVNDAACKLCEKPKEEFYDHTVTECNPGIERTHLFIEMKKCMANRIPISIEEEIDFLDGKKRWLRFSIHPHSQGIFVLSEDITELKRAEKLVRESEEMYHEIVSKSPNVILIQREGKILYANPTAEEMTGYRLEEVIGRLVLDFIDEPYKKTVSANTIKRARGEKIPDYEIKVLSKTGEKRDMLVRGTTIDYRGNSAIMNIIVDFTERRKIENELRESKEILQKMLDGMMEGFQVIGKDWRYIYLNDSAVKHSKKEREELIGKTMMECYPGIEKTELMGELKRCMTNRIPSRMENEFEYQDGTVGKFILSIYPHPQGIFILSEDITNVGKTSQKTRLF